MLGRESIKEKTAKGLLWSGLSNSLQQLLGLVFGIILARKLSQADYGIVGMLAIFSAIAACLQEGGFIAALNRKKDVTRADYNAVFWMSISISLFFYLLFFFTAPLIARFYDEPRLVSLARYTFLSFLFVSFSIAPRAYIFRNMMVRQSSIISLVSLALSGIVGVIMAYLGFAYWGLATQSIVFTLTVSVLNFWYSGWRPSFNIDLRPIRELIGFSSKLIVTSIVTAVNGNMISVLLGRYYSATEVGNFSQANKWNTMGHSLITSMLYNVAQPILTKADGDMARQKKIFRKLLRFTALVSFPAMLCLALISEEFIVILITEKWLPSAHLLRILCIAGSVMPISYLFSNLLISRGRSDVYMWCTIAFCLAQLAGMFLCVPYGIGTMVTVFAIINILWTLVWFWFSRHEIDLHFSEAVRDISPYLMLSVCIVAVAYYLTSGMSNIYLSIVTKVVFVFSVYGAALWLLGSTIFKEAILFITKKKIE